MRILWRAPAVVMLIVVWPQLGCFQFCGCKTGGQSRPLQEHPVVRPKLEPSPADKAQTLLNQADSFDKIGKANDAVALYEKLRQSGGEYAVVATKRLAAIHVRNDNLDQAEQEYQILLQHDKKDADTLCRLGYIHYRRGRMGTAEKYLTDATYYQPNHKEAWINLGMVQAHDKDYTASIASFKKCFSEAEAYCNVAFVLNMQHRRDDAMRAYQTALKLDPKMERARLELAKMEVAGATQAVATTTAHHPKRLELPPPPSVRVDLEPAPPNSQASSEGLSRLMPPRQTLPPLPDLDLTAGSGPDWESSATKK